MLAKLLFIFAITGHLAASIELPIVYLTWEDDPTTTMTIRWITSFKDRNDDVEYRKKTERSWHEKSGQSRELIANFLQLHSIKLSGLTPDTAYKFYLKGSKTTHYFKTLPKKLTHPINFIVGGDTSQNGLAYFEKTNKQAARHEPAFVIFGGDLAYTCSGNRSIPENGLKWISWLYCYARTMISPNGYMIPLLVTMGNHDVIGGFDGSNDDANSFFRFFPLPGKPGYSTLRAGKYLSLYLLDSGHMNQIEGKQYSWLKRELKRDSAISHRFAIYHMPAFPGLRKNLSEQGKKILELWVPLFEKYNVHASFEHHEHIYKRSFSFKANKIDPTGPVYLGGGAWGVTPRKCKKPPEYIARSQGQRHFIKIELEDKIRKYSAITDKGSVIDYFVQVNP